MTSGVTGSAVPRTNAVLGIMREAGSAGDAARHPYPPARGRLVAPLLGGDDRRTGGGRARADRPRQAAGRNPRHRPAQEFRTYELLDEPLPTPKVHGMEHSDDTPFGGSFFVIDRLAGTDLNVWRRRDRATLEADWAGERMIATDLLDCLAKIHRVSTERVRGKIAPRDYAETLHCWHSVQRDMQLVPIVEALDDVCNPPAV